MKPLMQTNAIQTFRKEFVSGFAAVSGESASPWQGLSGIELRALLIVAARPAWDSHAKVSRMFFCCWFVGGGIRNKVNKENTSQTEEIESHPTSELFFTHRIRHRTPCNRFYRDLQHPEAVSDRRSFTRKL